MRNYMTIIPKCDMLINQNIRIGSDPIGHICFNDAAFQNSEYFICEECHNHLINNTGNITVPLFGTVKTFNSFINKM